MVELIILIGIGLLTILFIVKINGNKKIKKNISQKDKNHNIEKKNKDSESLNKREIYNKVGFSGIIYPSSNNQYFVYSNPGHFENESWINGKIAVFKQKTLLFIKELEQPNDCAISQEGISICCDWSNSTELSGKFYVFDKKGNELFFLKTHSNLGSCSISENGEITIIETHNSNSPDGNSLFIINLKESLIINKIKRPISFKKIKIDTETKTIELITKNETIFKIDFYGKHLNFSEYKKQLIDKGNRNDILLFYSKLPKEIKFQDEEYLHTLEKATINEDSYVSLRNEKVYREIGEFYETKGNFEKTIEYWEKAIEINPKVGIKRKLDKYKKKL